MGRGVPRRHGPLTLFPLLTRDAPELPYALMSDALELGTLRITEVGSGSVPELLAINNGDSTVLLLDGEQLIGAGGGGLAGGLPPDRRSPRAAGGGC